MDDDLRTFVRRVNDLLAEEPEMSTRNVQLRIVEPLLSMLGWDVRAPEVEAEESLETLEDPIDYVLLVDDRPDIAVRTMAADESIGEDSVAIFARGIVSAGIDLGIVSNGHRFAFITTDGTEIKWTLCAVDELPAHESILTHFTQAMATQRLATTVDARQRAAARLEEERPAVTEAIARELQSVADEPLDGELRTLSRVILDVAIERFSEGDSPIDSDGTTPLREPGHSSTEPHAADDEAPESAGASADTASTADSQPQSSPTPAEPSSTPEDPSAGQQAEPTTSAESSASSPAADAQSTATQEPAPTASASTAGGADASSQQQAASVEADQSTESETDPSDDRTTDRVTDPIAKAREEQPDEEYVVRFFNERTGVGAIGNPTPQGALAGTIEYLCQQRALDNYLSLPWGVKDGQALLTRDPEHPDGTPMEPAHELDNGYYLWTAIGGDACRSTIKDLAENLGLRVMFQGDWN